LFAVEERAEAGSFELNPQTVPGVGRHRNSNPVASLPANDVKRAAGAVDGFVKNEIVLKGVGPDDVIIVRIFCPPDNAGGAILRPSDGLELYLNEAVLNVGVVLQK
jgi:hypothetical protein